MKHKKIVIKIGTSVLAKKNGTIDANTIESIASQVSRLLGAGIKVTIVSSGAIGAGIGVLKLKSIPASLADLQATAAIGQNELMRMYSDAFKKRKHLVAQILLTQDDFDERRRYLNIKYTLDTLLERGVVPIINENDTVSTEEIKCGDNDRLSSLVVDLSGADALVILTDVDGLYDKDGKVIRAVDKIKDDIKRLAGKKSLAFTTGGMATKIEAAERAVLSGADCFIANGRIENVVTSLFRGEGVFTHFKAEQVKAKAKKRWIAYSSKTKGRIIIDAGAKKALVASHKSLLASGIIGKEGNFVAGDAVTIADRENAEFARGLTNYSSKEIGMIKGLKTSEIKDVLGHKDHDEVVHRDNLVIL